MFTKAHAEAYFNAEKAESLLFMAIGIVAIAAAVAGLLIARSGLAKGAAFPLIIIGIMQIVVGYTVYARSDKQRQDIVYKMDLNPAAIKLEEVPRMETVMKKFEVYRYTEIALLMVGSFLFFFFRKNEAQGFWAGLGIALAIQAGLMLLADGFAEKRGKTYLSGIKQFSSLPK